MSPSDPGELRARDDAALRRRLQWLMVGRLVVTTLLLGMTFVLGDAAGLTSFTPQFLLGIATATYIASLVFAVALPKSGVALDRAASVQLAWDLFMAASLMYISGGLTSAFTFLFGVAILMAALIVGPRASLVVAVAALVIFLVVGVPLSRGWLPIPPDQPSTRYVLPLGRVAFPLLANVVALLLVGLLASTLSERLQQTRGELRRATESAATLARLNSNIVQSLVSGLLTTDLDGIVQTINPSGARMFGQEEAALLSRPVFDLLPLPPGDEWQRGEGQGGLPTGRRFPVGFSVSPLIGSDQEVIGRLVAFQDLTEISKLRDAATRAERLATLGRLSAGLAHEIRNPLSSIRGSVELVREAGTLSQEDHRLLGIVLKEVQRLDELVTTMLQVGRPLTPRCTATSLDKLVREVAEVARTSLETHGVQAVVEDLEPVDVWADGDHVRQVVWNLLKNAIQASPPDGIVTIATCDEGDRGVVEVKDQGEGIAEEAQQRLFETFYSTRPHGVGIGLALVHQIVEAHGGKVVLQSKPGHGATFRVLFPKHA